MTDHILYGNKDSVSLNHTNTVGIMATEKLRTNQTRKLQFTPSLLVDWAEAVAETYSESESVEVVFSPNRPMYAQLPADEDEDEPLLGVAVTPRVEGLDE